MAKKIDDTMIAEIKRIIDVQEDDMLVILVGKPDSCSGFLEGKTSYIQEALRKAIIHSEKAVLEKINPVNRLLRMLEETFGFIEKTKAAKPQAPVEKPVTKRKRLVPGSTSKKAWKSSK